MGSVVMQAEGDSDTFLCVWRLGLPASRLRRAPPAPFFNAERVWAYCSTAGRDAFCDSLDRSPAERRAPHSSATQLLRLGPRAVLIGSSTADRESGPDGRRSGALARDGPGGGYVRR